MPKPQHAREGTLLRIQGLNVETVSMAPNRERSGRVPATVSILDGL
jgi:hypothetical protein